MLPTGPALRRNGVLAACGSDQRLGLYVQAHQGYFDAGKHAPVYPNFRTPIFDIDASREPIFTEAKVVAYQRGGACSCPQTKLQQLALGRLQSEERKGDR